MAGGCVPDYVSHYKYLGIFDLETEFKHKKDSAAFGCAVFDLDLIKKTDEAGTLLIY